MVFLRGVHLLQNKCRDKIDCILSNLYKQFSMLEIKMIVPGWIFPEQTVRQGFKSKLFIWEMV